MDETSVDAELQNFFSKSSLEDWKEIALQETKGEDPFKKLSWRGEDEILFFPYYDATSDSDLQFIRDFAMSQPANAPRQWLNLPLVKAQNAREANELAVEHLMNGADGVVCDVRAVTNPDLKVLTYNIEWQHCYMGFYAGANFSFLESLRDVIQDTLDPTAVNGALFWETIPKTNDLAFYIERSPSFRALGLLIPQSSPAEELSNALLRAVNVFDAFSSHDNIESVFHSIAFSLPADVTLLETAAKFKAMRILWFQVARAYGLSGYNPARLFIHARAEEVPDGAFGPLENMIKGTFAGMAALMGECNGLTIESAGAPSFAARCARNVSSILREESFFDRDADPLAGAWAVESMTKAIAEKAWSMFQEKSKTYAKT